MPEFVSVENVRISLLPATLFQRFAAITIDIVLVLIVMGLSSLVVYSFYTRELDPFIPLFSLFFFFLPVLEEITFNGRTIGKLCLRLRVVQIDGSAPTVWTLILRYFLLWIDVFGSFGSGLLLIFGTKLHRRWGDLAAGTFVAQSGSNYGNRSPLHAFDDLPNYERTFSRIDRIDARRAAEKGDQHIVERGRGARQEFRLRLGERGELKIERGGEHTDHRGHTIVGQRAFEQLEISSSHGQPHTDDRAHEGRNEHRADDHRRGIEVQAEAGDENGKDEHPKVRAAKSDPVADLLHGGCFVGFIGQGVEKSLGDSPNIVLRRVHCVVFSLMFSPQTDHHLTGSVSVLRSAY